MRIAHLEARLVALPLRREIKHASAARRDSTNLVVRCRLADGTEGWGEGVPRSYVTGETPAGTLDQLAATDLAAQLSADCTNWDDVIALCERFQLAQMVDDPRDAYGNAALAAVELAILDAFGCLFGEPLSTVTARYAPAAPIRAQSDTVRYSGAIMAEGARAERRSAIKMRLYGFSQCKVKVGVAGADDAARLRTIRRWVGSRMDLRLDANEAWRPDELIARVAPLLPFRPTCLEQPIPHEDVSALAELRPQLGVPIMLDESLTSEHDAHEAIRLRTCDLFNIRISKCGGFLASLRLAACAAAAGLGYQLGCHPGESGILSSAGRHFATSVANIRFLEGSYDRHVLAERLTREDLTFRYGGRAPALTAPGLGITIDLPTLDHVTTDRKTFNI